MVGPAIKREGARQLVGGNERNTTSGEYAGNKFRKGQEGQEAGGNGMSTDVQSQPRSKGTLFLPVETKVTNPGVLTNRGRVQQRQTLRKRGQRKQSKPCVGMPVNSCSRSGSSKRRLPG